jgi:hypothetical protein
MRGQVFGAFALDSPASSVLGHIEPNMSLIWKMACQAKSRDLLGLVPSLQRQLWSQMQQSNVPKIRNIAADLRHRQLFICTGALSSRSSTTKILIPWLSRAMNTEAPRENEASKQRGAPATNPVGAGSVAAQREASRRAREEARRGKNKQTAMYLSGTLLFAITMSYAAVPIYRMFCQHTGFGGTVKTDSVRADCIPHCEYPLRHMACL